MESTVLSSLHLRKSATTKKPKQKKKPIRLRYISNPMKIETSASSFMALVQELTGQDAAEFHDAPAKSDGIPRGADPVVSDVAKKGNVEENRVLDGADRFPDYYEQLDADVFVHQTVENFSGCLSNWFYNFDEASMDSMWIEYFHG